MLEVKNGFARDYGSLFIEIIFKFHERHFFMMCTKIVHVKSSYFILGTNAPEIYTVRKFYEISAISMNNNYFGFARDYGSLFIEIFSNFMKGIFS